MLLLLVLSGTGDQLLGSLSLFLSLISISNSCRRNTHLMSLGFESCFVSRYLRAAWSVYTITFDPTKYDLNLSMAKPLQVILFLWLCNFSGHHLECDWHNK